MIFKIINTIVGKIISYSVAIHSMLWMFEMVGQGFTIQIDSEKLMALAIHRRTGRTFVMNLLEGDKYEIEAVEETS